MFQTIFVYTTVPLFMSLLGLLGNMCQNRIINNKKIYPLRIEIVFSILLFAVVFGMRYDVGTDHLDYLSSYISHDFARYEYVFKAISSFFSDNHFHFTVYFFFLCLIQISFLYLSLRDEKFLYPIVPIVLFCGQYFWHWMNGIRQDLAACIFLYSVIFIVRRKPIYYLLFCLLAIGFHQSAIMLIFFYPLLYRGYDYTKCQLIQLLILSLCFVIGYFRINILMYMTGVLEYVYERFVNYSVYTIDVIGNFGDITNIGMSAVFQYIIDVVIIKYSASLKNRFYNKKFLCYYNLYFFGTIMQTLFMNNMLLARPFRYFRLFKLVIASYLIYYLLKNRTKENMFYLILLALCYIGLLSAIISNEPFWFYWDF